MAREGFKETLNFHLKLKKKDEANLERVLKENDEINIPYCIRCLCGTMMQIKFTELILDGVSITEAIDYLMDTSKWKKTTEEIRTKFNVLKSVS